MNPKIKGRLLIVDDESLVVETLCRFFSNRGYQTVGSKSGMEAVEILRKQKFDLILTDLDLKMPDMNGIELLKSAKEIDPDLVGIIMTGHAEEDTILNLKEAGAHALILKPFSLEKLQKIISEAIEKRKPDSKKS